MTKEKSNFFWPSYGDLMTSLFFVMLVLYVLTFLKLKTQQRATEAQLNKIRKIENSIRALPKQYFTYNEKYKRYTITKQIQFEAGASRINPRYEEYLEGVGGSIRDLLKSLKMDYPNEDISYLLIIEGMASRDNYSQNHELSYKRALALLNFWQGRGINLDERLCEVQIAGSGTGGTGRYPSHEEYRNQCFLIQIIPKIGNI